MRPTSRCYNCGIPGHQTQVCPHYGPRFPGPGMTVADYEETAQKIRNLLAADIINEHNSDHSEDEDLENLQARRRERRRTGSDTAGAGTQTEAGEHEDSPSGDSALQPGSGVAAGG